MTSQMEILLSQIDNEKERQSFLDSLNPNYGKHKITLNISDDEQAKIFALLELKEKLAGSNRTEVIRSLINIGFNHIVSETWNLEVDTDYKYQNTNEVIRCSLSIYLSTLDLNYRRANSFMDGRCNNGLYHGEPQDYDYEWTKYFNEIMQEDMEHIYDVQRINMIKELEKEARTERDPNTVDFIEEEKNNVNS